MIDEIRERYLRNRRLLSEVERSRILTYGTTAAKMLLECFDDLGSLIDDEECRKATAEPTEVPRPGG